MNPEQNEDLHGNVPDKCNAALLIIDMINDFDFPGGDRLLEHSLLVAERISRLKQRARQTGIPIIYVNDNFGKWRSDITCLIDHCLTDGMPGRPVVHLLVPGPEDYVVLKPKHSGFYSTVLETLLTYLGARRLILTGVASNSCILFTAADAFLRDYEIHVPSDGSASQEKEDHEFTLKQLRQVLDANTTPTTELDLDRLKR
ncbi:MAG: cysteine hydrolase [Armatimonadetes bacterium]|nr:cysteine hydrolase [Armatimonadota bacterium]